MRFTLITFLAATLTLCISAISAPPQTAEEAYDELLKVQTFNFGGAGIAGSKTLGEQCFEVILNDPNNLALFQSTLTQGSTEAKMYALTGIQQLAPTKFDAAVKSAAISKMTVNTMSGCLMMLVNASNVVQSIKTGDMNPMNGFMISKRDIGIRGKKIETNK